MLLVFVPALFFAWLYFGIKSGAVNKPVDYFFSTYLFLIKISLSFAQMIPSNTLLNILTKTSKYSCFFNDNNIVNAAFLDTCPRKVKRGLSGHEKPAKPIINEWFNPYLCYSDLFT